MGTLHAGLVRGRKPITEDVLAKLKLVRLRRTISDEVQMGRLGSSAVRLSLPISANAQLKWMTYLQKSPQVTSSRSLLEGCGEQYKSLFDWSNLRIGSLIQTYVLSCLVKRPEICPI